MVLLDEECPLDWQKVLTLLLKQLEVFLAFKIMKVGDVGQLALVLAVTALAETFIF